MTEKERDDRALEALIVSKLLPSCEKIDDQRLPSIPGDKRRTLPSFQPGFLDSILDRAKKGDLENVTEEKCDKQELAYGMNRADDEGVEHDDEMSQNRKDMMSEFEEEDQNGNGDRDGG